MTYISQIKARIKGLEGEKQFLNRTTDIADELFNTGLSKVLTPVAASFQSKAGEEQASESEPSLESLAIASWLNISKR